MKAEFARALIKQLHNKELGRDAQRTLVSLCKHDDCRNEIIKLNFVKMLVDRLAKDKYFKEARRSLDALIKHQNVRAELLKKPSHFISILEDTIVAGGVTLVDLGDAMQSFCTYDDIRNAIFESDFVKILVKNTREGAIWGLEVASQLLQSKAFRIRESRQSTWFAISDDT
ncbi:hypothetical protein FIBSPDRAFT_490463 [Athelia psychrophila]|uniref:ARM repeat-containing protein n=1 Tax=Athelia psychrophila TaxID=1759441 RepID=A0A166KLW5_9AGAM|nr:hypothetical protein FIBSPDRAFT_490463 [Fibularhizoctonia sp. CBS 109695]